MPERLGDLASRFGCELEGDPEVTVERVATLSGAGSGTLTFLASDAYKEQLPTTSAAAVVLSREHAPLAPCPALVADNPYATYARIAAVLHAEPAPAAGVHAGAVVADTAEVDPTASIGPGAVVGDASSIAAGVVVGPNAVVGPNCIVAANARLHANVTLVRNVRLGERSIVHPGAVIGSDGFGNAMTDSGWLKVPQVGGVRVGADVEIGANTTIDCGAVEDTVIEDGVRIDNLCMIAHNVHVGAHTAMAAMVGIAGSTRIGKRCMFAGQAGSVGHITICDDVVVSGQAVISKSITEPGVYAGSFVAEKARDWSRKVARFRRLDSLFGRVRDLEKQG